MKLHKKSNIFFHGPSRKGLSSVCSHVSCFADFVYPIQALSYYYQATQDSRAAEIACCCAEHMCELQGDSGQWWWHFDNRTGRVLERYPDPDWIIKLDRDWKGKPSADVWVIPPAIGGGASPCVGVFQRIMRF